MHTMLQFFGIIGMHDFSLAKKCCETSTEGESPIPLFIGVGTGGLGVEPPNFVDWGAQPHPT